jgi:hypothetical protein
MNLKLNKMASLYKIKELEEKLIEDKEGSESLTYIKMMSETIRFLEIKENSKKRTYSRKEERKEEDNDYFTRMAQQIKEEFGFSQGSLV